MVVAVVNNNMVVIGIVFEKIVCPSDFLLRADLGTEANFLAKVPVQCQMVSESGNQLAIVELSLWAQFAVVQQIDVFGFLRFEVKVHSKLITVRENDFPLIQL